MTKVDNLTKLSLFLAIITVPAAYLSSQIVSFILKSWNPSSINTGSVLAYLSVSIYFGLAVLAAFFIATIITAIKSIRQSHKLAWLSIFISSVEILVFLAFLASRG